MNSIQERFHFSIDVGGTFTDCLAVDSGGSESIHKILSSGITKGGGRMIAENMVLDDSHRGAVDDFWRGAQLHVVDASGHRTDSAIVAGFDSASGTFQLDRSLDLSNSMIRFELDAGKQAPVLAIHHALGIPVDQPLPPCDVDLGTTRGTNALLTRTGARTALVTSAGLQDFLLIGDQARPALFELNIRKNVPLFETAIEIRERVLADGTVEMAPDPAEVEQKLRLIKSSGIDSIAVCLMFSFQFPQHEQQVGDIAQRIGFSSIRLSSSVAPMIKLIPRGETTVLDAYLDPVIADYLNRVQSQLDPDSQLRFMTSAGGLVSRSRFSGKDSVLSGPAGGVVGAARIGQQAGFKRIIGFDMGGTSTDVSRFDASVGTFQRSYETVKAGVRIVSPMLDVETVAAGGGSVCWFDGTRLRVGPQSAGADPGPASYGRDGPLTVTDVNLFLGRIQTEIFPFALDEKTVEMRLHHLQTQLVEAGYKMTLDEITGGLIDIANQNMAAAIQTVSVAAGYDPRDHSLVSFGGAGSQHCCGVADRLGIDQILDHPRSSVLSAVGIQLADQSSHAMETLLLPLTGMDSSQQDQVFRSLKDKVCSALVGEGYQKDQIAVRFALDLRYEGTDTALTIHQPSNIGDFASEFELLHRRQFGYVQQRPLEVVAARAIGTVPGRRLDPLPLRDIAQVEVERAERAHPFWSHGKRVNGGCFRRDELKPGRRVVGPAIIADRHSTTVVDSGWAAQTIDEGILLLRRERPARHSSASAEHSVGSPDPIQLEIFNNHFSSIARQMGVSLQRTSVSVNVKERLDFSCAIFTRSGSLVVNAPHIPVHLGAMSETVRATIRDNPDVVSGDVFVTNDPFAGGSHLPDVTVVTPVFDPADGTSLWFWVASRCHHAEIGGRTPGSMPPDATCLAEEGVLIRNFRLIEGKPDTEGSSPVVEHFDRLHQLLTAAEFPSRSPDMNVADLRAQVAANQTGLKMLIELVEQSSFEYVQSYMKFIQEAAEQKVRSALRDLPDGTFRFEDSMDNDATIRVTMTKEDDGLDIDFTGTDPTVPDNLNANPAIVSAAIMYVMRLLIREDIPLNEGVMKPVQLKLPECFLNPSSADDPWKCPAIVGGNVETSQRIVDVLIGALGLASASQGTMNNWLMGSESFGYYETLGGGAGATPEASGADAVHSHMTNTRLTDPEVLESRYPVVVRQFAIRNGSGGAGAHRGGDGLIREVEFLRPLTVSLLTSRRNRRPFALEGGQPGAAGRNQLIKVRQDEGVQHTFSTMDLPYRCQVDVRTGDRLRIETPGGGGWGDAG